MPLIHPHPSRIHRHGDFLSILPVPGGKHGGVGITFPCIIFAEGKLQLAGEADGGGQSAFGADFTDTPSGVVVCPAFPIGETVEWYTLVVFP